MYYFAHIQSFQTDKMSTLDEKYEDEGYRNLMKNFAASAASGDLEGLEKGLTEVHICFQQFTEVNIFFSRGLLRFFHGSVSGQKPVFSYPHKSEEQPIFSTFKHLQVAFLTGPTQKVRVKTLYLAVGLLHFHFFWLGFCHPQTLRTFGWNQSKKHSVLSILA